MTLQLYGELVEGGTLSFDLNEIEYIFHSDRILYVRQRASGVEVVKLDTVKPSIGEVLELVQERNEFLQELVNLLGLQLDASPDPIDATHRAIQKAVQELVRERVRLQEKGGTDDLYFDLYLRTLESLEKDLALTVGSELPPLSRLRIVREQIRTLFVTAQRTAFEAFKERSFEQFVMDVETAIGVGSDPVKKTLSMQERMDRALRFLHVLVDEP